VRFSDGGWKDIQKIHGTYSGTGNGTGNPDKTSDKIQKNIGRDWTKHRTNSGRDIRQVPDETSDEMDAEVVRKFDGLGLCALGYGMESTHRNSEYGPDTHTLSRRM
jgi:hypothetical protein